MYKNNLGRREQVKIGSRALQTYEIGLNKHRQLDKQTQAVGIAYQKKAVGDNKHRQQGLTNMGSRA